MHSHFLEGLSEAVATCWIAAARPDWCCGQNEAKQKARALRLKPKPAGRRALYRPSRATLAQDG